MPEISRFFGIVIRMFFDDHPPPLGAGPHFAFACQGAAADLTKGASRCPRE